MPAVINGYRRFQCRLTATGNAVADGFKQFTFVCGLYFLAAQIGGQRVEALTDSTVAVIVVTMALGAKCLVNGFASGDYGRIITF